MAGHKLPAVTIGNVMMSTTAAGTYTDIKSSICHNVLAKEIAGCSEW